MFMYSVERFSWKNHYYWACFSGFLKRFPVSVRVAFRNSHQSFFKPQNSYLFVRYYTESKRRQLDITIPYKWEEQFANIERVFERKEGPPVQMLEIKNVTDNDVEDKVSTVDTVINFHFFIFLILFFFSFFFFFCFCTFPFFSFFCYHGTTELNVRI